MSDKTRREERWCLHHHVWKVQDDRSGFIEFSSNVIIDHRGRVTKPEFADPIHWIERPIPPVVDNGGKIPFARKDPLKGLHPDNPDSEVPGALQRPE